MNELNRIIPESESPTREGMLPAVVAVVSTTLVCLIVAVLAYGLAGP